MARESIRCAGRILAETWLADDAVVLPSELHPPDRDSAYATQDEMTTLLAVDPSHRAAGWKVGATSPGVQKAEGYDGPIPGRILASTIRINGASFPLTRCRDAKVEAEVAFQFNSAPIRKKGGFTLEDLAKIVTALPAFDITGTRYASSCRAGWDGRQKMLAGIADNGNGGAVVVGEGTSSWGSVDFMQLRVELRVNGGVPVPNLWDLSRGHPLDALVWTVNEVYKRGFTLSLGRRCADRFTDGAPGRASGRSCRLPYTRSGQPRLSV